LNSQYVKRILEQESIRVKKKYGQNFLINKDALNQIIDASKIDLNTEVIEIGPGLGFLTKKLHTSCKKVVAYEIDPEMVLHLQKEFKDSTNVIIKEKDFLKVDIEEDINNEFETQNIIVVANLPYYITTAILSKILEETSRIKSIVVMVQKEVADRLCGTPSTKDYNSLSVYIQYYTKPSFCFLVKANSFYPVPLVDSAVVRLDYKKRNDLDDSEESYFKKFVHLIFAQRRKTLYNNLLKSNISKEFIKKVIQENGFKESVRAEELSIDEIILLSKRFYDYQKSINND
jgi:16S rRNA (adenine1518-N6/adenine1519-N6)-dimethyltransferase